MVELKIGHFFLASCFFLGITTSRLNQAHAEKINLYNNTIRVSNQGNNSEECWRHETVPCKTIEFAMKREQLNYTRILLENGIHNLSTVLMPRYLEHFAIEGDISSDIVPSIRCIASNAGIIFRNCRQIDLVNLKVENCGTIVRSTNLDIRNSTHARTWNVSTALHIKETTDVTMSNVTIVKSCGYGAVFYDVIGSVLITGATFSENTERNSNHSPGYASGGGIYIELRPNCKRSSLFMNSNSNYTFINCRFVNNYAEQQKSIPSYSTCEQFISYGRGGGVSFFSRGNARNNNLTIIGCHFDGNIALWGGGVFAEFDQHTGSNMVTIQQSHFVNNIGFLGGGGVRVGINSDLKNGPNVVFVKDSTFVNNSALVGGGFSQYRPSGDGKSKEKLTIDNCTFSANVADRGAAIILVRMEVDIVNSSIESHVNAFSKQHYYQGEGCAYMYASFVALFGNNRFASNMLTGVMLDSGNIRNTGNLSFYNNTGMDGGGMALYGDSTILMVPHSALKFEYNTARKRGGALYVERPVSSQIQMNSTEVEMRSCFFLFGNDFTEDLDPDLSETMTYFIGNSAPDSFGSNIYADTITDCRRDNEPLYDNSAFRWKVFKYVGSKHKDGRTTVVTNPVKIVNVSFHEWSAYPGLPLNPTVVLLDENYNSVFSNIRVTVIPKMNSNVSIHGTSLYFIRNKIGYIRFDGSPFERYSVLIETTSGPSISKFLDGLVLQKCPLGYYYEEKHRICVCLSQKFSMHYGVTKCDSASSVYILNGRWGDPLITNDSKYKEFAVNICPENYCNTSNNGDGIEHVFNPNLQCATGRNETSVLCGKCDSDKSVAFGNEHCKPCKDNFGLFWLLLILFCLTALVFIIILFNIDTYATSLNAFLYSYQIIALCTHGNTTLDVFIKIVTAITTISGLGDDKIGICLWENMNDLEKMFFNYIIPAYLILCLFAISKLSYYFSNQCFLNRSPAVLRAFVFVSVIAYSDFTRITFDLLHPVKVRDQWVVYKAGFARYFHDEHIWFALVAIFVGIFVVILFPLSLLLSHIVIAIPRFVRLQVIFNMFDLPFRRLARFNIFCSFYFLTRLALLSLYIFIPQGTVKDTIFAIVSVAILLLFVYVKPYNAESMNAYDTILLMNLSVLAIINLSLDGVIDDRLPMQKVVHVLTYVPLACAGWKFAMWCWRKYEGARRNGSIRGKQLNLARAICYRKALLDCQTTMRFQVY